MTMHVFIYANSADPDGILHYPAFHLGSSLFAKITFQLENG